ncbi:hypothetical protein [Halovulum sp. GXIMD14793]
MAFWQYRPFSIRFPEDSPLRRMMVASAPAGEGPPWPGKEEAARFDDRTLFWDLRWDQDTGLFSALGPPLENLTDAVQHIRLTVEQDGATIAQNLEMQAEPHGPNVQRYVSKTPLKMNPRGKKHISAYSGDLPLGNIELSGHRNKIGRIVAVTMQRNSDPDRLIDWLDYLLVHGIDGAVIYDDGSQNHGAIRDRLRDRNVDQSVLLVGWRMLAGPARFPRLCYAQDGHVAHAHMWFGQADWMLFLPSFGFPVLPKGSRFSDILAEQKPTTGALRIKGQTLLAEDAQTVRSARDLTHSAAHHDARDILAVRPNATRAITQNQASLHSRFTERSARPAQLICQYAAPLITETDPFRFQVPQTCLHPQRDDTLSSQFKQIDTQRSG